jgi:hypothetical protein
MGFAAAATEPRYLQIARATATGIDTPVQVQTR